MSFTYHGLEHTQIDGIPCTLFKYEDENGVEWQIRRVYDVNAIVHTHSGKPFPVSHSPWTEALWFFHLQTHWPFAETLIRELTDDKKELKSEMAELREIISVLKSSNDTATRWATARERECSIRLRKNIEYRDTISGLQATIRAADRTIDVLMGDPLPQKSFSEMQKEIESNQPIGWGFSQEELLLHIRKLNAKIAKLEDAPCCIPEYSCDPDLSWNCPICNKSGSGKTSHTCGKTVG